MNILLWYHRKIFKNKYEKLIIRNFIDSYLFCVMIIEASTDNDYENEDE